MRKHWLLTVDGYEKAVWEGDLQVTDPNFPAVAMRYGVIPRYDYAEAREKGSTGWGCSGAVKLEEIEVPEAGHDVH